MLRPGQVVFLCVLALLTVGVVMVNSAEMSVHPDHAVTFESIVFSRPAVFMVLAIAAMGVVSVLPVRGLARWTLDLIQPRGWSAPADQSLSAHVFSLAWLWAACVGLLLVLSAAYWPVIGREVNGSHRWVGLPNKDGPITFQPSEIAKWLMILVIAAYIRQTGPRLAQLVRGLFPALIAIGLVSGMIVIEDLGTGVLVAGVLCVMLIAGGARVTHFLLFVPLAGAAFAAAVIANPYRIERLVAFLNPYADPQGSGYHMIQSMVAVKNGEIFGRGLGFGLQKFGYLPEDRTDFLFAVICEELGLAGAGLVIGLYLVLVWTAAGIVRRERDIFFKAVGLGVIAMVGCQAVINLAVVTGLGPTKGIALPMLSAGGTGWILTAASLGLLVAMDRSSPAHAGLDAGFAARGPDRTPDRATTSWPRAEAHA